MGKGKKYVIWIVAIIAVFVVFFYFRSGKPKAQYATEDIRKVNVIQTVSVTGELTSEDQASLAFKSTGNLQEIGVDIGDKVEAGQEIASIETTDLEVSLKQAEQDLNYQRNMLYNMKRRKATYNSQQENAQRALVKKALLEVEDLKNKISENSLHAPFAGIVISRKIDPGELAIAGSVVVTIAKEGDLILESNIPESDVVKIAVGQKAIVMLDAFSSSEIFEAEIFEIEPAATVIQDVVYYKTKLKFIETDPRFKNGMSADIDIKTAEKSNVLAVPARAIKTEGDKKYVEILKNAENQEIEKRYIQTGLEGDEGLIEVVSGLNEGENVITLVKTQ